MKKNTIQRVLHILNVEYAKIEKVDKNRRVEQERVYNTLWTFANLIFVQDEGGVNTGIGQAEDGQHIALRKDGTVLYFNHEEKV